VTAALGTVFGRAAPAARLELDLRLRPTGGGGTGISDITHPILCERRRPFLARPGPLARQARRA
jgi:hypothetical protein